MPKTSPASTWTITSRAATPIKHLVVLFDENESFDHYFGTYPFATNADGTKTYQWRSQYPISTYLVSVAISNYSRLDDLYPPLAGGTGMPVQHYVYPELVFPADNDFAPTVPMLIFFACTSGFFGIRTVSTPSFRFASTFSASAPSGRANERVKVP